MSTKPLPRTFSLIIVDRVDGDLVSGTWLQDCCRGLAEARERCAATSAMNSGTPMALVPSFGGPCPFLDGARVDGVRHFGMAGVLAAAGV